MSKKIVVLNGSPRPKGNTAMLVGEFVRGAESSGNSVTVFALAKMNIKPCIGCMKGGKDRNSPCVQKDDMDKIYSAYMEADVIVLASPLYHWSVSGLLKITFDRLYATVEANAHAIPVKKCILLMAAANASPEVYAPYIAFHDALMRNMGWTDAGKVLATGVMIPGDIAGTPWLEEAQRLGASL